MNKSFFTTPLGLLRTIGFLEGLSYIVLLAIAMPLKYYANKPEAVKHVGMAHGVLFTLFILLISYNAFKDKWPLTKVFWAAISSIIPFGTFYADAKLFRK